MIAQIQAYLCWKYLPIFIPVFVLGFLYLDRWLGRRRAMKLGALAPDVGVPGILGVGFFWEAIRTWREDKALEFWQEIFEKNGCAARNSYTSEVSVLGSTRIIITADPENVKAALATQFGDWGKGKDLHHVFRNFLGDGILTTDKEQWQSARQLMRPLFMRERVSDLNLFERNIQRLIPRLGHGESVEVDDLIFRYTLDAISEFLLGSRVGSLEDQSNIFTTAFSEVQRVQSVLMRAGPLEWAIPRTSYLANIKILESYIEPFISQALALPQGSTEISKSDTLLHALASYTRSRKIIRDQLTSVLFAGSDTTASALSWVFFELARNPAVVAKLRQLILDTLGSDQDRLPTYEEIKNMKYLTYVINESQRLYATMPFATRQALNDTTLPRGGGPDGSLPIGVKKDTPVIYSAMLMHRRRDLYPPISEKFPYDPLQWVPERWETWQPKSWQLIPFSGGPRICLGQNFAVLEMAYTICRLLQHFEHLVDYSGGEAPVFKCGIVVTPAAGVRVGFLRPGEEVPRNLVKGEKKVDFV